MNADSPKAKTIVILNSVLTKAVYAFYPLLLIYLAVYHLTDKEPGFLPALLVNNHLGFHPQKLQN